MWFLETFYADSMVFSIGKSSMQQFYPWLLALVAGCFLALMIAINGQMAAQTSPMLASWLAHGVGAAAALLLVMLLISNWKINKEQQEKEKLKLPE